MINDEAMIRDEVAAHRAIARAARLAEREANCAAMCLYCQAGRAARRTEHGYWIHNSYHCPAAPIRERAYQQERGNDE